MTQATPTASPLPPPTSAPEAECPVARFMPHAILAGAMLLFVAFFMPWWGLTGMPDDRPGFGNVAQVKVPGLLAKNASWYATYAVWDRFQKQRDATLDAARQGEDVKIGQVSISLHGWDTGPGVVAFIFFFLAVAIVLGPMFVPVLRPVAWVGYLASGLAYSGVFLATVIGWLFCSPGENVAGQLAQGVSVGVWFALFGSALAAAAGTKAGLKGLKSRRAAGRK
ncbi:MAG: hypothetical protein WCK05_06435 [Planctomycetota bacterium]